MQETPQIRPIPNPEAERSLCSILKPTGKYILLGYSSDGNILDEEQSIKIFLSVILALHGASVALLARFELEMKWKGIHSAAGSINQKTRKKQVPKEKRIEAQKSSK